MHSPRLTSLSLKLNTEHWLAVANEIQHGRNKIRVLGLAMFEGTSSEATAALKAIASAIRRDRNLVGLMVGLTNGFMDEEGVALAEALTVIKTLRWVVLADTSTDVHTRATLGARAYEAFSAMLRVNTSLTRLDLPPLDRAGGDQRLVESYDQMRIEQGLNKVGRGKLLSSNQTTRGAWIDALHELNVTNADDTSAFQVSCLYSFLRLKPSAWML
jgi:hypothetical protein